jgi:hypothetical protein
VMGGPIPIDDLVAEKLVFRGRGIMVRSLGSGRWIGLKTNLRLGPNSCEDLTSKVRQEGQRSWPELSAPIC